MNDYNSYNEILHTINLRWEIHISKRDIISKEIVSPTVIPFPKDYIESRPKI